MVRIARKKSSKAPRRKYMRKGRVYKKRNPKGYFKVVRQSRPWVIRNSGVAGVAVVSGYAGTVAPLNVCVLGTPEQDTNFSQNVWNVPFSMSFNLAQALNYQEFTALFDNYRIRGVALKLKYNGNTFDGSNTAGRAQNQPVLKYVYDNDDVLPPSSVISFNEKMGIRSTIFNENRYTKLFIKPKYSVGVADAANITSSGVGRNMWLNCSDDSIEHFGIKGYIEGMPLGATTALTSVIQVEMKMYLEFKDVQ